MASRASWPKIAGGAIPPAPIKTRIQIQELPMSKSLIRRMQGAAMLDVPTFEEVEHDRTATGQAVAVVLIAAVAEAIGGLGSGVGLVGGAVAALVRWGTWSGVTWFIGTRVFKGTADWGELLRTIGFAQAPAVLLALGFIPLVWVFVAPLVSIWLLIATLIGIRQALDISTGQAFLTAALGLIPYAVLLAILL